MVFALRTTISEAFALGEPPIDTVFKAARGEIRRAKATGIVIRMGIVCLMLANSHFVVHHLLGLRRVAIRIKVPGPGLHHYLLLLRIKGCIVCVCKENITF